MKNFLLPLIAFFSFPTVVNSGTPFDINSWVSLDGVFRNYQINTLDAKARGSKIIVGINRKMTNAEAVDGYSKLNWNGKVVVSCRKFKYTITAKMGRGLTSRTYNITRDDLGYKLADNLCYLAGVEGYTKNEDTPYWASETIKTIERNKRSSSINCDSPVWKNKPRCK